MVDVADIALVLKAGAHCNFGYLRYFLLLFVFCMFACALCMYVHVYHSMCVEVIACRVTLLLPLCGLWDGPPPSAWGLSTFTPGAVSLATYLVSEIKDLFLSLSDSADLVSIVCWKFLELGKFDVVNTLKAFLSMGFEFASLVSTRNLGNQNSTDVGNLLPLCPPNATLPFTFGLFLESFLFEWAQEIKLHCMYLVSNPHSVRLFLNRNF